MDSHVKEYYREIKGKKQDPEAFYKVIALHEESLDFSEVTKLVPNFPKGWLELCHLKLEDRIEFSRDFWLSKLPYHPHAQAFFMDWFTRLDDMGVFITQKTKTSPFEAHLVYSIKDDGGFFQGNLPMLADEKSLLLSDFPDVIFPQDFISFMEIHNGFQKLDDTGIFPSFDIKSAQPDFQNIVTAEEVLKTNKGLMIDPKRLIAFYESYGTHCYQCFLKDWYPEQEMGNIYYSYLTKTVSDIDEGIVLSDEMAFTTFTDWLIFYLERIV